MENVESKISEPPDLKNFVGKDAPRPPYNAPPIENTLRRPRVRRSGNLIKVTISIYCYISRRR